MYGSFLGLSLTNSFPSCTCKGHTHAACAVLRQFTNASDCLRAYDTQQTHDSAAQTHAWSGLCGRLMSSFRLMHTHLHMTVGGIHNTGNMHTSSTSPSTATILLMKTGSCSQKCCFSSSAPAAGWKMMMSPAFGSLSHSITLRHMHTIQSVCCCSVLTQHESVLGNTVGLPQYSAIAQPIVPCSPHAYTHHSNQLGKQYVVAYKSGNDGSL